MQALALLVGQCLLDRKILALIFVIFIIKISIYPVSQIAILLSAVKLL